MLQPSRSTIALLAACDAVAFCQAPSYATTTTEIRSTTMMIRLSPSPNSPITTIQRALTVTSYEPGPVTDLPALLIATAVTRATNLTLVDGSPITVYSATLTSPRTWVVFERELGDLSPEAAAALPAACGVGRPSGSSAGDTGGLAYEDDRCLARGSGTGCERQCQLRDAGEVQAWWCYRLDKDDELGSLNESMRMGRACWRSKDGYGYLPLNTPCLDGDYRVGCRPYIGNRTAEMES